jgi:imidazolonepropionase-like amidohydrolase
MTGDPGLLLTGGRLIDTRRGVAMPETDILIAAGSIAAVGRGLVVSPGVPEVALHGRTVVPGFIDAHVHAAAARSDLTASALLPATYVAAAAYRSLREMLQRGFTTVRDNGGVDRGIALTAEEGIDGPMPRVYFCGRALSQTGGHGDFRGPHSGHDSCSSIGVVCDGVDAVRRTIRQQFRDGASHVKLMLSGGVTSQHDRIDARQFSDDEVRAAVEEAENVGSYVTGHAYTSDAITRAVNLGVRCIEHGNLLDAPAADAMAEAGSYLVPTLITYAALARDVAEAQAPTFVVDKLRRVVDAGLQALEVVRAAGVSVAFGTDLLGSHQSMQLEEFAIRREVQSNAEVLRSATAIGADLLSESDRLGGIFAGAAADLIVTEMNPLTGRLETILAGESFVVSKGALIG